MITIIDYGAGNLRSISRAIQRYGHATEITSDPETILRADRLVLPGVGNARAAMNQLQCSGIASALTERVNEGVPLLGVCLGMQLLFGDQEEGPTTGLQLLEGTAERLSTDAKIPHMGWNSVEFTDRPEMKDIPTGWYYFVHSYVVKPTHQSDVAGTTQYGQPFASMVIRDHIWGTQFHPEKSHTNGLSLIKRWLDS